MALEDDLLLFFIGAAFGIMLKPVIIDRIIPIVLSRYGYKKEKNRA